MTRRRRHGLAALAGALLVGTAAVAGITLSGASVATPRAVGEQELPTALAGHLAQLAKTAPGNQGMANEGPASAAEAAFLQRAYPADTISLAAAARAQAAFSSAKGRPFPKGKGKKGTWISVGPSQGALPEDPVP